MNFWKKNEAKEEIQVKEKNVRKLMKIKKELMILSLKKIKE